MKLSEYFTLEELTYSRTAAEHDIDNVPSAELIEHAKKYLIPGIDSVRLYLGKPVLVSSGYRSPALNKVVPGSSDTSQHTKFEAIDFTSPRFGTPLDIAKALIKARKEGKVNFDQMIYEYGTWIHISFSENPRGKVLSKYSGTPYLSGLVDKKGKPL